MRILWSTENIKNTITYTFMSTQDFESDKGLKCNTCIEAFNFRATFGSRVSCCGCEENCLRVLVGTGSKDDWTTRKARKLGSMLARSMDSQLSIMLDLSNVDNALELLESFYLRYWNFSKYRQKTKENSRLSLETVYVKASTNVQEAFSTLLPVLEANHWARELSEEPANVCNSEYLEQQAKSIPGVTVKVINKEELQELNMNALLGVAQGSVIPPKLIIIEYKGAQDDQLQPYAFLGKGILFDTGGISLKPSKDMGDMKKDMSGAAVVLGIMKSISANKLPVNAVGFLAVAENMPGGNAQRPGDVVRSANGQTIEIVNTDAEGRLVLCDTLWYAQNFYNPSIIIDYATLTGAILIALGNTFGGMYTPDETLASELKAAGDATGEELWRMPLHPDYDEDINSPIADIANLGRSSPFSGSNTAAAFLARFINPGARWVHLDIAGTSYSRGEAFSAGPGSTGYGVRLTYNWLVNRINK